jgi:ubiquinone/menaquinone biosynthesis C-methylase UbiE
MTELGGWASSKAALRLRVQSDMVPGRDEALALIAELAASCASSPPRFLDLGCGHGDVSAEILARLPAASVTLLDFSAEMLARARARFGDNGRIETMQHDLRDGLPPALAGPFDAVVSCFTLHNVEPASRVRVYADARRVLRREGLVITGDRVREDAPAMQSWAFDRWIAWMTERARTRYGSRKTAPEIRARQLELDGALGDRPDSIWAMREDMRRAGFTQIDCLYKNQITAVMVAVNQG